MQGDLTSDVCDILTFHLSDDRGEWPYARNITSNEEEGLFDASLSRWNREHLFSEPHTRRVGCFCFFYFRMVRSLYTREMSRDTRDERSDEAIQQK